MTPLTSAQRRNTGFKMLLSAACVVIVIAGMKTASELLIPMVLGVFLAVLSLPLVGWLHGKRVPRLLAVVIAVIVDVMVLSLLIFIVVSVMPDFQESAQKYEAKFRDFLMKNAVALQDWVNTRLGPFQEWMSENFGETGAEIGTGTAAGGADMLDLKSVVEQVLSLNSLISVVNWVNQVNIVQTLISLVTKTFFAFIIMIFILLEAEKFADKVGPMIEARGPNFRRFRTVGRELQQYLAIKTVASLVTGLLAGLTCGLMGVEFAAVWGLVAFLFNFVPTVGSLIAAIPPVLVSLLQLGFWQSGFIALAYLAINVTIGNFIEPTMLGRGFGISTVVVILSVLFWGWLWGGVGMFLAVPLTMSIKIMLESSDDFRWVAVAISKEKGAEEMQAVLQEHEAVIEERRDEPGPDAEAEDELSPGSLQG